MVRPSCLHLSHTVSGKILQFPLPYNAAIVCRVRVHSVSAEQRYRLFLYQLGNLRQVSVPNILLIMLLQLLVAIACFALFSTARQVSVIFDLAWF
jgi:hypothetical protein